MCAYFLTLFVFEHCCDAVLFVSRLLCNDLTYVIRGTEHTCADMAFVVLVQARLPAEWTSPLGVCVTGLMLRPLVLEVSAALRACPLYVERAHGEECRCVLGALAAGVYSLRTSN
jgi:hypothetical protein